jgi:epoxyqueuosine reductase QueG
MVQRVLPEWSGDELEYVEPTQVARSFGYDVFANEYGPETFEWNEQTVACVPEVDGEVAADRTEFPTPERASEAVKRVALELGAAMVGVAHVDPFHVYKGHDLSHRFAVLLAVPMEYDEMKHGATERHVREVIRIYAVAGRLAVKLAQHIRSLGYPARAHTLRFEQINMLPHAIAAGLGELGKHGSLINRELGCSFRLSAVTTDLPLAEDEPRDWGVDAVCANCNMCTKYCPGDAIADDKQMVRGIWRWMVDTEACAPYWGSYYACGICLEVCPFNARGFGGRYKTSFIDMIKSIDLERWREELRAGLQRPWQHVQPPSTREAGWRNNVEGRGESGVLMQGIPRSGLPDEIYRIRAAMGIAPPAR